MTAFPGDRKSQEIVESSVHESFCDQGPISEASLNNPGVHVHAAGHRHTRGLSSLLTPGSAPTATDLECKAEKWCVTHGCDRVWTRCCRRSVGVRQGHSHEGPSWLPSYLWDTCSPILLLFIHSTSTDRAPHPCARGAGTAHSRPLCPRSSAP